MSVIRGWEQYPADQRGAVVTIGNFDGVHRGHRRIVRAARDGAVQLAAPVVAMTFEPHPIAVLAPQKAPARLTTPAEKATLLREAGADHVVLQPVDRQFLNLSAEQFLDQLARWIAPRRLVEGPTFNFGKDRAGSIETLREAGPRYRWSVELVDELYCDEMAGRPAINSSAVRRAVAEGDVAAARKMLGRAYRIVGTVASGAGRGGPLGFPTANLDQIWHLLPGEGVYAGVAELPDGQRAAAAINVGPQPTFDSAQRRVEAHLLDFDGALGTRRLGLWFLARLRSVQRFSDAKALKRQIGTDVAQTRSVVGEVDLQQVCPKLSLADAAAPR